MVSLFSASTEGRICIDAFRSSTISSFLNGMGDWSYNHKKYTLSQMKIVLLRFIVCTHILSFSLYMYFFSSSFDSSYIGKEYNRKRQNYTSTSHIQ